MQSECDLLRRRMSQCVTPYGPSSVTQRNSISGEKEREKKRLGHDTVTTKTLDTAAAAAAAAADEPRGLDYGIQCSGGQIKAAGAARQGPSETDRTGRAHRQD